MRTGSRACTFFFQAEDGIRYHCVTGVQTCALPISPRIILVDFEDHIPERQILVVGRHQKVRSEERRVGKECRSWWSRDFCKHKVDKRIRRGVDIGHRMSAPTRDGNTTM